MEQTKDCKRYYYKFTRLQDLKYLASKFTRFFGRLHPMPNRKEGISVMCLVKDEADWVSLSLQSLEGFADEVIMIDNGSSDNTIAAMEAMREKVSYQLIIKSNPDPDFCNISNQALNLTSYRWIMRWGADFIAYSSGERNLCNLRKALLAMPANNYYVIYPLIVNFSGDLFHVKKGFELHSEHYILTWHKKAKYRKVRHYNTLTVPWFFSIKRDYRIWIAHIGSAKTYQKLIYRYFWVDWRSRRNFDIFPNIETFVKKEYDLVWESDAFKKYMQKAFYDMIFSKVRPYEIKEFGNYPALLKSYLENPPFKITYKDGKPVSRSDF